MNKVAPFFDDILKIIAVSSVLLITAGFFDMQTYYHHFDISINEYTTPSEIFLSSINRFAGVIFLLIIHMIIWFYYFDYLFDFDLDEEMKDGKPRPNFQPYGNETIGRFFKHKFFRRFWITIILGWVVSFSLFMIFSDNQLIKWFRSFFSYNIFIGMCIYMGWLTATRDMWLAIKNNKKYNAKVVVTVVVFFTILLPLIWIKNIYDFQGVWRHGHAQIITIHLHDNTKVSSTDTIRYVGRTQDYFFFWDKITRESHIYPKGEVKKVALHLK